MDSSSSSSEDEIEVLPQGPETDSSSSSEDEVQVLHQTTAPVRRAGTAPPTTAPVRHEGTAPPTTAPVRHEGTAPPTTAAVRREGTAPPTDATGPTAQVPGTHFEQPQIVADVAALLQQDNLYAQMLQETFEAEMLAYPNPERLLIAHLDDSFSSGEDYDDHSGQDENDDDDDDDFYQDAAIVNAVRNSPSVASRNSRNYHSEYDSDSDEDDDHQVAFPSGLRVSEINKLRTRKYILLESPELWNGDDWNVSGVSSSSKRNYNRECIICAVEYTGGDVLRVLPCLHEFHSKCVDKWLKRKSVCPLCCSIIDKNDL